FAGGWLRPSYLANRAIGRPRRVGNGIGADAQIGEAGIERRFVTPGRRDHADLPHVLRAERKFREELEIAVKPLRSAIVPIGAGTHQAQAALHRLGWQRLVERPGFAGLLVYERSGPGVKDSSRSRR